MATVVPMLMPSMASVEASPRSMELMMASTGREGVDGVLATSAPVSASIPIRSVKVPPPRPSALLSSRSVNVTANQGLSLCVRVASTHPHANRPRGHPPTTGRGTGRQGRVSTRLVENLADGRSTPSSFVDQRRRQSARSTSEPGIGRQIRPIRAPRARPLARCDRPAPLRRVWRDRGRTRSRPSSQPAHLADPLVALSISRSRARKGPTRAARSTSPSRSMISTLRTPTAQATGCPV